MATDHPEHGGLLLPLGPGLRLAALGPGGVGEQGDVHLGSGEVRGWQEMSGDVRRCQEMAGDVRRCLGMSGDVRRCQEMSGDVRRCQEMAGDTRRCQEMSGDGRRWQDRTHLTKNSGGIKCYKMT